jgi:hypothetical protein
LVQANIGTGLAVDSTCTQLLVRNNIFLGNNIGISANTANASFIGNLAYGNTTTNYLLLDSSALYATQISNGSQLTPGTVIDRTINNISITSA